MGLRGPKRKSAEELSKSPGNAHRLKLRLQEEARARAKVTMPPGTYVPPLPPTGLSHPTAIAYWQETVAGFKFDAQALAIFVQVCYALQAAEECREVVAAEGRTRIDDHGRPWQRPESKMELEHRRRFSQLCKDLGFLTRE